MASADSPFNTTHHSSLGDACSMTQVIPGKSRVREIRTPGSVKAKAEWLLIALGLTGMAKALEEQRRQGDLAALGFEERLALMIDRETIEREDKRMASRLKIARLRQSAVAEDVNLKVSRGLETVTAFFEDMKRRGLNDPLLVTSDGAPGIIKAVFRRAILTPRIASSENVTRWAALGRWLTEQR